MITISLRVPWADLHGSIGVRERAQGCRLDEACVTFQDEQVERGGKKVLRGALHLWFSHDKSPGTYPNSFLPLFIPSLPDQINNKKSSPLLRTMCKWYPCYTVRTNLCSLSSRCLVFTHSMRWHVLLAATPSSTGFLETLRLATVPPSCSNWKPSWRACFRTWWVLVCRKSRSV